MPPGGALVAIGPDQSLLFVFYLLVLFSAVSVVCQKAEIEQLNKQIAKLHRNRSQRGQPIKVLRFTTFDDAMAIFPFPFFETNGSVR